MNRTVAVLAGVVLAAGCAHRTSVVPAPVPPPPPSAVERYAALPDTAVCIVDRTTRRGLRLLDARVEPDGKVVVLVAGTVQDLDALHPIRAASGYAARETWVTSGGPIPFLDRRYEKVEPERLIPLNMIQRIDDYRSVPLFSDPSDPAPPRAIYVPLRPGCVFQAYVRSDLLR